MVTINDSEWCLRFGVALLHVAEKVHIVHVW